MQKMRINILHDIFASSSVYDRYLEKLKMNINKIRMKLYVGNSKIFRR